MGISGDADIDGTLEAAAITVNGTAIGYIYSAIAGSSNIVTTGILDSGSITSNFGSINNGASAITTTGALTGGSLIVNDVTIDGKVITMTGSSGDTAVFTAKTNGALDIITTDTDGADANIQITADGTAELAGTTVTLNSSNNIDLDADGGNIVFKDGGTPIGKFTISNTDFVIKSVVQDKDIIFKGDDGGVEITALTLDMSEAGAATFNSNLTISGDIILDDGGSLKEAGGTAALTFDGSGHITKIGQDSPSTGEFLKWEDGKAVWDSASGGGTVQNYSNEVYASKVTKTDSAVGTGFNGTGSLCDIFINKFGGEIITTIQIDITGLYGGTGGDVIIGKNEAASNFYQITSSNNGIVYKIELICIEAPLAGNSNGGQSYAIGLQVNPTDSYGVDASAFNHNDEANPASTGYDYLIDATTYDQILGKYAVSVPPAIPPSPNWSWVNGLNNKFLHLYAGYGNGSGDSTNDAYTAGKFLVKLYGSTF